MFLLIFTYVVFVVTPGSNNNFSPAAATVGAFRPAQQPPHPLSPHSLASGVSKSAKDFSASCGVPAVELWCDMHGAELFYISDLCCSACELENRATTTDPA